MQTTFTNPCVRCGKLRITSKTWTEYVGISKSPMVRSETICPDKDCQKLVMQDFEEKRLKKEAIMNRKTLTKPTATS